MELCYLPTAAKRRSGSAIVLVFVVVALSLIGDFRSDAQVLPDQEVQVLLEVARKMGMGGWNATTITLDSCTDPNMTIRCDCSFNNSTICHVTLIWLEGLGLRGELPEEFANLTYLSELYLGNNYLNGTIPRRFASLPLVNLSLWGNLIEGTIPREFGNIVTLELLNLVDNKIGGPLPEELGNLPNLRLIDHRKRRPKPNNIGLAQITEAERSWMEREFSEVEIKQAVDSLAKEKTLGPDGYQS